MGEPVSYFDDVLAELMTGAELQHLTPEQCDAHSYQIAKREQLEVWSAIGEMRCSQGCAAALDPLGPCDCICEGLYHGSVWIRDLHWEAEEEEEDDWDRYE